MLCLESKVALAEDDNFRVTEHAHRANAVDVALEKRELAIRFL